MIFDKIRIAYVSELNRITKAAADIKKDEVCLFIPKKVLICDDTINETNNPLIKLFNSKGINSHNFDKVSGRFEQLNWIAFMIEESHKGPDSYWYHYL